MFDELMAAIRNNVIYRIYHYDIQLQQPAPAAQQPRQMVTNRDDEEGGRKPVKAGAKTGRNDPCPCGSGKKHKKCCGR